MPSKFRLRRIFKPLVIRIAKILSNWGLKPNQASFVMLMLSIISLLCLVLLDNLILFGIFVFATGFFDGVDGAIARLTQQSTKFGAFLDSSLDRVSETIIFAALYVGGINFFLFNSEFYQIIVIITCICSLLISYLRARAENEIDGDFDIGLFARSERLFGIFIISIFSLIPMFFSWGFIFLSIGIISTLIFRFIKYRAYFKDYEDMVD